ncbi:hypothetical protein LTS18_008206 [Coniosporium uncinatum]|uniref:Uncharacterized protein n=1 Tax=Coniosporium uncinatum TaxID=93489 RepID=A0ACC3D256_9PEZI|nr:hypothetical protein LTS18_008206 [Coniosporium uncinatum]
MTPSLDSLPEELVDRIVSYLPQSSQCILSRVSKHFNRIATPRLYFSIYFRNATMDKGTPWLLHLTYLLLKKPSLAIFVHSVTLRDVLCDGQVPLPADFKDNDNGTRKALRWPQEPDLDDVLNAGLKRYSASKTRSKNKRLEEQLSKLKSGCEGGILALLLLHLPKLRKLDFSFFSAPLLLETFQQVANKNAPVDSVLVFQELTDVMFNGCDEKEPNPPDLFFACFGLPVVNRIHANRLGNNMQDEPTAVIAEMEPRSSSVEFVEMRCSKLWQNDLVNVLRACKKLKTLIHEVGNT